MLDPVVKDALDSLPISYEVQGCDPDFADTAAYCKRYNFLPDTCANTILVAGKDNKSQVVETVACVVLATDRLDVNKKVRGLLGTKKASFASGEQTVELTGMQIGGVVVFGLPDSIRVLVDQKVMTKDQVIMGGGNRASKLLLDPKALQKLQNVRVEDISI